MQKKLHLIYITGLSDGRVGGQRLSVTAWRLWGVEAELFQVNWANGEPWQQKFQRLLGRVDVLAAEGKQVGLVGVSAGASAAINAYAARRDRVAGCVLIAGKVNRPAAIGSAYSITNPAFVTSVQDCQHSLASLGKTSRQRIMSRYALIDRIVYKADSQIDGAHNRMVISIGHALTIALQITFGVPLWLRFLNVQMKLAYR